MKSWKNNNMLREEYDFNPRGSEDSNKFFQTKIQELHGLLQDLLYSKCLYDNEEMYLKEVEDAVWDMMAHHGLVKER